MYDGNELISSTLVEREAESENILRPQTLEGYIGQDKVKENLMVYISAARRRNENLDHVLLYGPPGLGKTTLAHIIANEMHTRITVTSGPAIEKAADLVALLSKLTENEVLFIDEIHRLNHSVEEILYPALEDYALDFIIGKGPSAKSIRLSLPRFTLVGATTKAGRLSAPLRDRFGVHARLEMYSTEQLVKIVRNSSKVLETEIDAEAAAMLAGRSRGTPRIANRLLKRVRDFAQVKGEGRITPEITDFALSCMGIDELGLDGVDRNIILSMIDKFNGGPVGLETVAAASGEDAGTIEDVYEPYLLQIGFLARTPRGRVCLPAAYRHYGRKAKSVFFSTEKSGKNENGAIRLLPAGGADCAGACLAARQLAVACLRRFGGRNPSQALLSD